MLDDWSSGLEARNEVAGNRLFSRSLNMFITKSLAPRSYCSAWFGDLYSLQLGAALHFPPLMSMTDDAMVRPLSLRRPC
jgi:hypothetical protein